MFTNKEETTTTTKQTRDKNRLNLIVKIKKKIIFIYGY